MNWRAVFVLVLICMLGVVALVAQSPTGAQAPVQRTAIAVDPEDAFLSPTRYTNAYFGFELDFPADARLKPMPMPSAMDRRIQLLDMIGSAPQHPGISICAYEYKNKNYTDAKGILRHQLDQELFAGVEELHGLAKTNIEGHQFYYFETRKGIEQHMELATEMNGYVLLAVLRANDPNMVKDLCAAFYHLTFFAPQEARQHAGPDASAYAGPAISAQHLREVKDAGPAEHMDPGKVADNVYRNAQIGITYEFPKGWSVQPHGAIEPAVERYREGFMDEPGMGARERAVVKACKRTLLSVWRTKPTDDGQVPYDEFGEVTLSAMPLSCFPNIQFPSDPNDAGAIRRFVVGLSYIQPLERDVTDVRSYEAGGKPFVLTRATIAYKVEGDALSRRVSVAMAMTQHRGYLLTWLFAAPHDSELRELLSEKVGFDSDPKAVESASAHSGGGAVSPAIAGKTAMAPASAKGPSENAEPDPPASATSNTTAPASQAPASPSLVGEGQASNTQQAQGKPLADKKPD